MESAGYLRTFRNHWILIVVIAALGLFIGSSVARSIAPTYESSATLFLKVESQGASLYERSQFSLQRIKSYGDLIKSPQLLDAVISDLDLDTTPIQLESRLEAVNPVNTVLLQVTAEAPSADEAAALANSAAAQLAASVDRLENTTDPASDDTPSSITLEPQIAAQAPTSPSSPNIPVILGLGLLAGLALGLILAIVLEAIRPRVRSASDVRRISGLPLIAQFPQRLTLQWAFPGRDLPPSLQTAVRTAASNLRALGRGTIPPIVTLVPVGRRPAHASTRVALARGIAATGRRVLLVEADIVNQRLDRLGIADDTAGLGEVLAGELVLQDAVVSVEDGRFEALPSGRTAGLPTEFAVEKALPATLGSIAADYDASVVQVTASSAPLNVAVLGPHVKGAVLVTSFALTSARGLRREIAQLNVLGIVPIGVVMMDVPAWRHRRLIETWREEDFVTTVAEPEPAVVATSEPAAEAEAVTEPEAAPAPAPKPPRRNTRTNRARTKRPPVRTEPATGTAEPTGPSTAVDLPADAPAPDADPADTPTTLFDEAEAETESSDASSR